MSYVFNPFIGNLDNAGDNSALTFVQSNSASILPDPNSIAISTNMPSYLENLVFSGVTLRKTVPPILSFRDYNGVNTVLSGAGNTFSGFVTIGTPLNLNNSFLTFNNLEYVDGSLTVSVGAGLTALSFPALKGITSGFSLQSVSTLSGIDLPELQYVAGSLVFGNSNFATNQDITEINLPKLQIVGSLTIGGYGSTTPPVLSSISFPLLKVAGNTSSAGITIGSSGLGGNNRFFYNLRGINFPALQIAGYANFTNLPSISAINFPSLKSLLGGTTYSSCSAVRDVYLNSLEILGGYSSAFGNLGSVSLTGMYITNLIHYIGGGSLAQFGSTAGLRELTFGTNTLKSFNATVFNANQSLTQQSVNNILLAFSRLDGTNQTSVFGSGRTLELAGSNSAPSYTGGVTLSAPGNVFIRTDSTVVAAVTSHGFTTGNIVTIAGNSQSALNGTYTVSADSIDQFRYTTTTTGSLTGGGATQTVLRRTTVATDGFRYFQTIALRGATVSINLP